MSTSRKGVCLFPHYYTSLVYGQEEAGIDTHHTKFAPLEAQSEPHDTVKGKQAVRKVPQLLLVQHPIALIAGSTRHVPGA